MPLPDVVAMQTRKLNLEGAGEIPLHRLVKEALWIRPSRVVVGEARIPARVSPRDLRLSADGHCPRRPATDTVEANGSAEGHFAPPKDTPGGVRAQRRRP